MARTGDSDTTFSRRRQSDIFLGPLSGKKPAVPTDYGRLEKAAQSVMSDEGFAYVAGGAGSESTIDSNRQAFGRLKLVPNVLRDVSDLDTSVELFGITYPVPFLLAPIGVLDMAHPKADLAVAHAAAKENVPFIFSSQASVNMETCSAVMEDHPRWFQLYWSKNNDLVKSFVQRAERCGCQAVVLTLDTTMLGWRPRDLDLISLPFLRARGIAQYTSDPVFLQMMESNDENLQERKVITPSSIRALFDMSSNYPGSFWKNLISGDPPKAVRTFIQTYSRPSLTWDDLSFLRDLTDLPVLLKGILRPDDARKAMDHGVDGLIVSNHGGRQLDGAISSLEALPGIVQATEERIPVLFDSGIRTGSDIVKAIALGARAVLLGRPYVYGLAIAGQRGVQEVIRNYRADFELSMGLCGRRSVSELNGDILSS